MKANELRVGNYISYFDKNLIVKRISVEPSGRYIGGSFIGNGDVWNNEDAFSGIPLTEEILLKSGFWKDKGSAFQMIPFSRFTIHFMEPYGNGIAVYSGSDGDDEPNLICILEYFHQLQNFWFLCTGQELTLTL